MKATVIAVAKTGRKTSNNADIFNVMTNPPAPGGVMFQCFSRRIEELQGKEIEFEIKESDYKGTKQYTLELPKSGGAGGGGAGRGYGKSTEELAIQKYQIESSHTMMARKYAVDVVVALINNQQLVIGDITTTVAVQKLKVAFWSAYDVIMDHAPVFQGAGPQVQIPEAEELPF